MIYTINLKIRGMKKIFNHNDWVQVGFKLTREQKQILKRKAHYNEMTISEYIRAKTIHNDE